MSTSPTKQTAASKLISSMMGNTRPGQTLPRQTSKLSRQSLLTDMNNLHSTAASMMSEMSNIRHAFQQPEVVNDPRVEDVKRLATILARDLKDFNEKLARIKDVQLAASNIEDDGEFHIEILNIGSEYHKWMSEFQQVVFPTYESLGKLINDILVNTQSGKPE